MKSLFLGLMIAIGCLGQSTPVDFVGGGFNISPATTTTPVRISGFLSYAQAVSATNRTYSYTVVDITSLDPTKPIQAATSTGVAQYVKTIAKVDIFALMAAGVSVNGTSPAGTTNIGASFTGGGVGITKIKGDIYAFVPVRILHTTTGGTQYLVGIGVGWGK